MMWKGIKSPCRRLVAEASVLTLDADEDDLGAGGSFVRLAALLRAGEEAGRAVVGGAAFVTKESGTGRPFAGRGHQ